MAVMVLVVLGGGEVTTRTRSQRTEVRANRPGSGQAASQEG